MRAGEVVGGEAARLQQGDRQRVAHRQRGGGAGGRRQVQRAGLLGDADVQVDLRRTRQRRIGTAGHGDQRVALPLEHRQQHQHLVALARVRQRQHHVGVGDHAQVAVAGLAGMHVEGRCAGGGQGGGDLARDVAGLAHAGADHAATRFQHQPAGAGEVAVQAGGHRLQCRGLDAEHALAAAGEVDGGGGIAGRCRGRIGHGRGVLGGGGPILPAPVVTAAPWPAPAFSGHAPAPPDDAAQ